MIRSTLPNEERAEQQDKIIKELLHISKEERKYKTDEDEFEVLISQLEPIAKEDTEQLAIVIPKIKHVIANIVLYCRNKDTENTALNLLALIEQKVPTSIQNARDIGHNSLVRIALTH